MESLGSQFYAFGIVLLAGTSLGIFFDLFRVLRGLLRPGFLSTPLLDLLFWALITPMLVLYLLLANWGELRGYVFIGLVLGFLFYRLLLSSLVVTVLLWSTRLLGGLLNVIFCFILWLVAAPLRLVQEARFSFSHRRRGFPWTLSRLRWRK